MFGDPVQNEKGWPLVRLDTIADIKIGPFGSLLHKEDYIEGGHALVNPSHIVDGKIVADPKLTISEDKYAELSSYALQLDDIVLGRRGEMGRCAVVYEEGLICGTGSMIIRPGSKMKSYFLQNIMSSSSFRRVIETNAVGITMKNLNVPTVSAFMFPELPIALQETYLKFVKQSDKSKFTGFKSQFIEMFGLPERNTHEYEIGTIGDVVKDVHYGTAKKASEDGRYIYIRMNNITYDGDLDLTDIKRIDVPKKDLSGCMVQEGDVLFNRTNSKDLVGKTCHFTGDEPMIIAGYIIRLRMNGKVLPEYVSTFMNLDRSKKLLYSMAKGAVGQANINAKEVQSIPIVIPPENVQQEFLKLRKQSDKSK